MLVYHNHWDFMHRWAFDQMQTVVTVTIRGRKNFVLFETRDNSHVLALFDQG